MLARLGVEPTESCANDVVDVLVVELEEPVDNLEDNDRHVVFRITLYPSAIFNEMW